MSLRINLNSAALNAHRQLQSTDSALSASIEKLSSGFRINRAADDPAGLSISENLRAQISGLGQAIKNSNDAVNMIRTAEGALAEVHSLLRNMRDLAVHAASPGSLDDTAIAADQSQIDAAVSALNRIATNTAFGNKKLLDGSGNLAGINLDTTNFAGMSAASSGSLLSEGNMSVTVDTAAFQAAKVHDTNVADGSALLANDATISVNTDSGSFSQAFLKATDSYDDVIQAINDADIGVTASWDGAGAGHLVLTGAEYGSDHYVTFSETAANFNAAATSYDAGSDIQAHAHIDGGAAITFNSGQGLVAETTAGDSISFETAGNSAADYANVFVVQGGALEFQIGANSGETTSVTISGTSATLLGVNALDVVTDASDAIDTIDDAIATVSAMRANLGAAQKNMEATINSLSISKENIAASESSIRDTDMAAEMVTFTRNQILLQAGTAMLTQANSAPQALLALLQ